MQAMIDDKEEKPGVVIDVTPEPEPAESVTADGQSGGETPDTAPAKRNGQALPLIVAGLSLVLAIAAIGFAYRHTRQAADDLERLNRSVEQTLAQQRALEQRLTEARRAVAEQAKRLTAQQRKLEAQEQHITEARQQFTEQNRHLDSEREQMQQREAELRAAVADVHKRVGASGTQWMVAEAEYLLHLANERLNLARDTRTARAALQLADQRLRDTGDPGWNPVREQIAHDIATFDTVEQADIDGISARLAALTEKVPRLRLAHVTRDGEPRKPSGTETTGAPREQRTWQTLIDDLWIGFKQTVRIRRNDQPVLAMLPPEQQYFLYENLRLRLEAARLAAVRSDERLYHDNLNTVTRWLSSYFDPNDEHTRALRDAVRELDRVKIRPPLPEISASLAALRARLKLLTDLGRPIAPETPATERRP